MAAVPQTLTARVLARVTHARIAVDRRANATRPKSQRRRVPVPGTASAVVQTQEEVRGSRSLKRVFHDLGVSYRTYRRKTGAPVAPALRAAAYHFRANPTLTSLVSVAGFLDDLDLLAW
jgi:hypothetical protein